MTKRERRRVVCLLGNGASIACHSGYRLDALTEQWVAAFERFQSLDSLARRLDPDNDGNLSFEDLVGALQRLSWALQPDVDDELPDALAELGAEARLVRNARELARWCRAVYIPAVASILDVLVNVHTTAEPTERAPLRRLLRWLLGVSDGGFVSVFSLNYDVLLESVLSDEQRASNFRWHDVFDGRESYEERLVLPGGETVSARLLRAETGAEPPHGYDLSVTHLHGGATWVREEESGQVLKLNLGDVRDAQLWREVASQGLTSYQPAVILGRTKQKDVRDEPFRTLFRDFRKAVHAADVLVVVGYGLGDLHVNRALSLFDEDRTGHVYVLNLAPTTAQVANEFRAKVFNGDTSRDSIRASRLGLSGKWEGTFSRTRTTVRGG